MKPEFTIREKVLMVILAVMLVFCGYYFLFLTPMTASMKDYTERTYEVQEQITIAKAKEQKLNQMKKELEVILSGQMGEVKELPLYDNSHNVMNELALILADASSYNVSFSDVETNEHTVRRQIGLDYDAVDYDTAKMILTKIRDGQYRCLLKDVYLTSNSKDGEGGYHVVVDITYYEYQK